MREFQTQQYTKVWSSTMADVEAVVTAAVVTTKRRVVIDSLCFTAPATAASSLIISSSNNDVAMTSVFNISTIAAKSSQFKDLNFKIGVGLGVYFQGTSTYGTMIIHYHLEGG